MPHHPQTPARLAAGALAALVQACAPTTIVRTADVLPPAGFGGGVLLVPFAHDLARSTVSENGHSTDVWGNAGRVGAPALDHPLATLPYAYGAGMEWGLRMGIAPRVELGLHYGLDRMGAELRVAAMDEDRGARASLAPSLAVARVPWAATRTEATTPWLRLGADLSHRRHRAGRDHLTPSLGLYLSHGPRHRLHHLGKDWGAPITDCKEGWPGTACGTRAPHSRAWVEASQRAWTLALPLSLSLQTLGPKRGGELTVGVVPEVVVASETAQIHGCPGCRSSVAARDHRPVGGLSLQVGIGARSTRDMRAPPRQRTSTTSTRSTSAGTRSPVPAGAPPAAPRHGRP